jgi:exonuclease SbcC
MMQLHRLALRNFRQHAETDIEFGLGITGIIGPNGAGKTTILEAIAWAFYGTPAARGNRDSIRWAGAQARASVRVEVEFSLGAHEFQVRRTLYSAELFQDHAPDPSVVGHQDVSVRIERLLGMTRDEFFSTYFTGQKELAVMASLPPTERAQFLSRVLGYEKLRLAQDRLRETRSGLKGELAGLERGLVDPEDLEREHEAADEQMRVAAAALADVERAGKDARDALDRLGPMWTRMVEIRESALKLDGELRIAERDVGEARREFERLDKELAEALKAQAEVATLQDALGEVDPLRAELERLEEESRRAGERRSLTGQVGEVDAQLKQQQERLVALGDAQTALEHARAALETSRTLLGQAEAEEATARTAWVRDRQDAETKRQSLRDQYVDRQKQRESVESEGPDGECPVCKRPLGSVYQEVLNTLDRQREEIEVQGKFFRRRVEQLQDPPPELMAAEERLRVQRAKTEAAVQVVARCEDRVREHEQLTRETETLTSRRDQLARKIADLPDAYDSERHDQVRQRLRELEPIITRQAELRSRAARAEALVGEAEAAERAASEREANLKAIEAALTDLGYDEREFDRAREEYHAAELRVRETELRLALVRGDQKAAEAALTAVRQRVAERENRERRIAAMRTEVALHDELDRALRDLRQELNAAMRPELAERASDFLSDLSDGRYNELELDEDYRFLLIEDGRAKPVISGGEEDILHLVLRLGISQMVAERAGQPLSLLVLDEVFGSLDEQRRRGVVTLLRGLADRFPQVVLITHIDSVKDTVDRVLRVNLDAGRGMAVVTEEDPVVGEPVAAA